VHAIQLDSEAFTGWLVLREGSEMVAEVVGTAGKASLAS